MKLTETGLAGVYIVEPAVFGDHRGFFMESWSKRAFEAAGLQYEFVQDNHSSSAVELSAENKRQLLIPRGFGHGFVTLTDDVEFLYKADNCYAPEADGGIRWDDPELAVHWGVAAPVLSEKDSKSPFLKDAVTGFEEW